MLTNAVEIKGIKIHVTSKRFPEPTGEGMTSTASYSDHMNVSGDREEAGGLRTQSHSLVLLTGLTRIRYVAAVHCNMGKLLTYLSFCSASDRTRLSNVE